MRPTPHQSPTVTAFLAAARSRSRSDSPPDYHSLRSRRFATSRGSLSLNPPKKGKGSMNLRLQKAFRPRSRIGLRLALFRPCHVSVTEIRVQRGSSGAKHCLGSRRKSSVPLRSTQDDTGEGNFGDWLRTRSVRKSIPKQPSESERIGLSSPS